MSPADEGKHAGGSDEFLEAYRGPLREFWDFVREVRGFWKWVGLAALAVPVTDLVLCLGAPWPNRMIVSVLTVVVEMMVLILTFQIISPWARAKKERLLLAGMVVSGCLGLAYIYFFATHYYAAPDRWNRVVGGAELTPLANAYLVAHPEDGNLGHVLEIVGDYDEEKVWTKASLGIFRVLAVALWLGFFAAVSIVFAVFVSLQKKRAPRTKAAAKAPSVGGGE